MTGSQFGNYFSISTFGESHGVGVGVVLDGVPSGIPITEEEIQLEMNRRKPGQSDLTTPRSEADKIIILSGVFQGVTTGVPIAIILYNKDAQSNDYNNLKELYRPGHADYTYHNKYHTRDWRGSGRASGRETAARVAAGSIAKKFLASKGIHFIAYTKRAAGIECQSYDPAVIEKNPIRACDLEAADKIVARLLELKGQKNSAGGIVEARISGLPVGLGSPVFRKVEALLGQAMLSLGSVKGFEIGSGFSCVDMLGDEHNDTMRKDGFVTNHAGGVLGGITTGEELIFRIAVKPPASIGISQPTLKQDGSEVDVEVEGRHDPIICPRIVPVVEAMSALVIADLWLEHQSLDNSNK